MKNRALLKLGSSEKSIARSFEQFEYFVEQYNGKISIKDPMKMKH